MSPGLPAPLPDSTMVPHGGPNVPAHLRDPLEARRNPKPSCFTPEQQREIADIAGLWFTSRLESIDANRVEELSDRLDYLIETYHLPKVTCAELAIWKAKRAQQPRLRE